MRASDGQRVYALCKVSVHVHQRSSTCYSYTLIPLSLNAHCSKQSKQKEQRKWISWILCRFAISACGCWVVCVLQTEEEHKIEPYGFLTRSEIWCAIRICRTPGDRSSSFESEQMGNMFSEVAWIRGCRARITHSRLAQSSFKGR